MKRIVFDPLVKSDLRSIKSYYEIQRPGLGEEFLSRVRNQFQQISRHPLAAPIVEEDVRKIGVEKFPFEIFYRADDEEIFVFAVIHQRRHQDSWKKRI